MPDVTLDAAPSFDAACAVVRGSGIDPAWRQELAAILPEFRQAWQARGPALLARVEAIVGKPFRQKRFQARLTLCDIPSNSFLGVTVNMRHALATFTDAPVSLRYKTTVVVHEILHRFLLDHPPRESVLLRDHGGEPAAVRNHLHLMALLKAAHLELGDVDGLKEAIRIDSRNPDSPYTRAWALVNLTPDTYRHYLDELR